MMTWDMISMDPDRFGVFGNQNIGNSNIMIKSCWNNNNNNNKIKYNNKLNDYKIFI